MNATKSINPIVISVLIILATFSAFFLSRDYLARITWEKYGNADLALALVSSDANLSMQLGNYYFNGGTYDLKKAETAFKKALASDPEILWGHYQLSRIYFVNQKYDDALNETKQEIEMNPENLRTFYMQGLIYGYRGMNGDLKRAEESFKNFVAWAPQEWAGYNDLAWILAIQRKYGKVKEVIADAFEKVPKAKENPWLLNSLGVAQLNTLEYKKAAETFSQAKYYATALSAQEWRNAYPGNRPEDADEALKQFLNAVENNKRKAENYALGQ